MRSKVNTKLEALKTISSDGHLMKFMGWILASAGIGSTVLGTFMVREGNEMIKEDQTNENE